MGVAIVEANEREFSSITVVRMLLVLVIKRIVSLVRVSKTCIAVWQTEFLFCL